MQRVETSSGAHGKVFRGLALIGGHPALDFLNTVKYRGAAAPGDRLSSLPEVVEWARVAGLIDAVEAAVLVPACTAPDCARLCAAIRRFREQVRRLFPVAGAAPDPAAAAAVEAAISRLRPVARIDRRDGRLDYTVPVAASPDLMARIVASVADLLVVLPGLRIGTCRGGDCDWLFVDRTKAGGRIWCDTSTCGNAARVRRHRLQRREPAAP